MPDLQTVVTVRPGLTWRRMAVDISPISPTYFLRSLLNLHVTRGG